MVITAGFEKPDMAHWHGEFNVAHPLAPDFGLSHLNAASVADNPAIANTFVFATVTFPVALRTENPLTEQPVALRFEGAVVDGLRLQNLAV